MSAEAEGAGHTDDATGTLRIAWSPLYHPEWDATPHAYVDAGVVASGRSRRMAKVTDERRDFKAYLGVQHFDPARWNLPGEPTAKFFASFFVSGHTAALHTYPAMADALAAVQWFAGMLAAR